MERSARAAGRSPRAFGQLRPAAALAISLSTAIGTTNHIALGQIVQHLGGDPKTLNLRVFDSALYAVDDVVEGKADAGVISAVSA